MRPLSSRKRRGRRQAILGSLLLFSVVGATVGIAIWKLKQPPGPTELLCPADGPKAHIAVLVDKTDPLSFTQGKAFDVLLQNIASGKLVKEGELVSVFVLGEDFQKNAEPLFEKCNPGDGHDKNRFQDSPELWKKRFSEEYAMPLLRLEDELQTKKPASRSPILEMVQLVSLRFQKHAVRGPRRVLMVSDMLHNTMDLSLYAETITFGEFMKRPSLHRLRAKLEGVGVEVFLLLNRPAVQNRGLIKFWEDYFKDAGAILQKVEPLPG